MNLLEVFFIISGVIIFFLALDIARKEKFNALHFFVFLSIGIGLLVFTFFPGVLDGIGRIFGIQRGADVLVYSSIIFLLYFSLLLLSKTESHRQNITHLIREMSLQGSRNATKNSQTSPLILLRAYNEAPIIKNTLKHLYTAGYKNILLVDDGSTDGTSQILSEFSQKHPEASLVKHAQNRGAGAALETGFEYIRRNILDAPYVITFDADGQHQVEDIEKIIQKFENYSEVDVIFGSRFLEGDTSKNIPTLRKYILKSGTIFTKLFSGIALTDAHNGLRGFRTSVLNNLRLQTDSMAYATELTELIAKQNISYAEVPVEILYTQYSLDKGQRSSNAIFIGLYAVWSKFFK